MSRNPFTTTYLTARAIPDMVRVGDRLTISGWPASRRAQVFEIVGTTAGLHVLQRPSRGYARHVRRLKARR